MKKQIIKKLTKAKKSFAAGKYSEALRICNQIVDEDISSVPTRFVTDLYELIGTSYKRLSDHDKAASYIAKAHLSDPNNKNIHLKLISYCSASNYVAKVKPLIDDALSKYSNDLTTLLVCSEVYLKSSNLYLAAEKLIANANRLDRDEKYRNDILLLSIELHGKKINKHLCIKAIDQLLKSQKLTQKHFVQAITHLIKFGENERALKLIQENENIHNTVIFTLNEGFCLHKLGFQAESISAYQRLIRLIIGGAKLPDLPVNNLPSSESLKLALTRLKHALNDLEVPFFLVAGTALGAVRDGDFLKKEKDLDIAVPHSVPRSQLLASLEEYGFASRFKDQVEAGETGEWCIPVEDLQTGVSTDIFFARSDQGQIKLGVDYMPPLIWQFSKFKLTEVSFMGDTFHVPGPVDKYFEEFYGPDWKEPQHYCAVLRSNALTSGSRLGASSYGYNKLISLMLEKNFDKAKAYLKQMKLVIEDDLLDQLDEKINIIRSENNV